MLSWPMASAAFKIVEPLERLLQSPPALARIENLDAATLSSPSKWVSAMLAAPSAARAKWFAAVRETVEDIRAAGHTGDVARELWKSIDALLSSLLASLAARIEATEQETADLLSTLPLPAPISYIRGYSKGVHEFFAAQHTELVGIYYELMAILAAGDDDAKPIDEILESDEDIDAFMSRVRAS
jgi:hypothetical protein